MIEKLTYKKKFAYLVIGCMISLVVVYKLAIIETIKVRNLYNGIQEQVAGVKHASSSIIFYEKEIKRIDSLIGTDKYIGNYTQDQLLMKISGYSRNNKLNIISFPGPHQYIDQDYRILTYQVSVSGGFNNLLKLLYEIETGNNPGVIKSAVFATTKLPGQTSEYLVLTLFVQDIKDVENESL